MSGRHCLETGEHMASDGIPVNGAVTRPVHGSQAPIAATVKSTGGKSLPAGGQGSAAPAGHVVPPANVEKHEPDLSALTAQLNKYAHESGRPNQYRVDASSGRQLIQEVNPDSGDVIGEYPASEFAALVRGLGISGALSGVLINSRA